MSAGHKHDKAPTLFARDSWATCTAEVPAKNVVQNFRISVYDTNTDFWDASVLYDCFDKVDSRRMLVRIRGHQEISFTERRISSRRSCVSVR
jgi:hypothetical protein